MIETTALPRHPTTLPSTKAQLLAHYQEEIVALELEIGRLTEQRNMAMALRQHCAKLPEDQLEALLRTRGGEHHARESATVEP